MDEIASCITKKDNTPDNAATAFSAFAIPIETPIANISARLSKMILPQSPPTLKIPYKTVPGPMILIRWYVRSIVSFVNDCPIPSKSPATSAEHQIFFLLFS